MKRTSPWVRKCALCGKEKTPFEFNRQPLHPKICRKCEEIIKKHEKSIKKRFYVAEVYH